MGVTLSPETRTSLVTLFEENAPLKKILLRAESSIADSLRGPITAPQLIRAALLQVSMSPALQKCSKESIVQSVMQAAALGLMVGGPTGEAALVPRKGKCVLTPMVRGLVSLAQRSGAVVAIPAHPVYKGDRFAVQLGSKLEIIHEPDLNRRGAVDEDVTHVYAIVVTPSGYRDPHYMTRDEVEEIRAVSSAAQEGPWKDWWTDMAIKTVVKRATKRYDMSPEFRAAVELDNRAETGRINEPSDLLDTAEEVQAHVVETTQQKTDELRERMKATGAKVVTPCRCKVKRTDGTHEPDCPQFADGE